MENMLAIAFLSIAVSSYILGIKHSSKFSSLLAYLFATASMLLIAKRSEEENVDTLIGSLMIITSLGFILSQINKIKNLRFAFVVPLLLSLALIIHGNQIFEINGFGFEFLGPVILLPILGTLFYPLMNVKSGFLRKTFDFSEENRLEEGVKFIVLGLLILVAFFLASFFGLFLLGFGLILSSFFTQDKVNHEGEALLLISLIPILLAHAGIDSVELGIGKTLSGLFVGVGIIVLNSELTSVNSRNLLLSFLGIVISAILIASLILFGTIKSDLGGSESYIGMIAGMSLSLVFTRRNEFVFTILPLVLVLGFYLIPFTVNKEEQELSSISISSVNKTNDDNKEKDLFEIEGRDLDSLQGKFTLDEKSVQLNFQLGPKGGITKGAIKSFSGKVNIADDLTKSTFEIVLPVEKLTTFNKFRDEAIFEETYFNLGKYSEMKYVSKSLRNEGDYYILDGDFTMIGVSKPLEVKLKYLGQMPNASGKMVPVLIGKSSIDRTKHGMTPDSKEGNVVDFEFKVELIENF